MDSGSCRIRSLSNCTNINGLNDVCFSKTNAKTTSISRDAGSNSTTNDGCFSTHDNNSFFIHACGFCGLFCGKYAFINYSSGINNGPRTV